MNWSPDLYSRFERDRTRPVMDLLARVETKRVQRAIDLGCGPGNSTEQLRLRYPAARLSALDSSPDMVAAARRRLPGLDVRQGDIALWDGADGPFDLILANASLHWVADHAGLMPRLRAQLGPGGSLAVQMPDNHGEPAHRLMREVAAEPPFRRRPLEVGEARAALPPEAWYYRLLAGPGVVVDLWRTTYLHVLPGGASAVVAWFESTGLRPYLAPLSADERREFLARYERRLIPLFPEQADGSVLLPFPRLFFVVRNAERS